MIVIGLTGSLGTGKSTVAALFARFGAKVLDADVIARDILAKKGRCAERVVRAFGPEILSRGRVDRKKLAAVVFGNRDKLRELERIVHPAVLDVIRRQTAVYRKSRRVKGIVLDVPLLFESGLDRDCDVIVVVKAGRHHQLQRSGRRLGLTRREALQRIKAQWPLKEKILLSDRVIDNRNGIEGTQSQVARIWRELTEE